MDTKRKARVSCNSGQRRPAMLLIVILIITLAISAYMIISHKKHIQLSIEMLLSLGLPNWNVVSYYDETVTVKSRAALEKYDAIKFFKENRDKLDQAEKIIAQKESLSRHLQVFLRSNEFESRFQYKKVKKSIEWLAKNAQAYRINVKYITHAGNHLASKEISLNHQAIDRFRQDPSLLMSKGAYNKYLKDQQKAALDQKQHNYYANVNSLIDYANKNKDSLIIHGSRDELDKLITRLFDRTVNSIKKVKTTDSEEWNLICGFITDTRESIERIVGENQRILDYYDSPAFSKVKASCETLMNAQKDFNDYINEKIHSISQLFGAKTARTETVSTDVNNYIRPYQKTITPFTAEVSAAVFASAENSPLEYVVKNFYPDKKAYPEQIRKLYSLVEELETLRDAKKILENYKVEYQQYLGDVPDYVMKNDEDGFYSRLGFAVINESVLTVEYKFSYTSGGGMAQRSFTVPMTEETIAELIKLLESKLTAGAFAKEQRNLMTKKLRESIKERDHFTCCLCGNSIEKEPNLLLEIDHIIPVAKGGCTTPENLQTLCWRCNRSKGARLGF